jgi:hypothetical protein
MHRAILGVWVGQTKRYAASTNVSISKSLKDVEKLLTANGATSFVSGWDPRQAMIMFEAHGRRFKFQLSMPDDSEAQFIYKFYGGKPTVLKLNQSQRKQKIEQAARQRWRALVLIIKAKLEAVASSIADFEEEFLAHVVMADGTSYGQWSRQQIANMYRTQEMPPMLSDSASSRT